MKNYKLKKCVCMITIVILFFAFSIHGYADTSSLDEAKQILQSYYVNNLPDSVLNASNMEQLVQGLGDPYTEYLTPDEYQSFIDSINFKVSGIGLNMNPSSNGISVTSVIANSPADKAGIESGDIIIEAGGHALENIPYEEALGYINVPPGDVVNLRVERGNFVLDFNIESKSYNMPTLIGDVVLGHIGYIGILTFGANTDVEFQDKLNELQKKNVDSYIIDLRNNPGGYLTSAVNIAGNFIGNNIALITQNKAEKKQYYYPEKQQYTIDKPVIFLINKYTASSAEVLSAAVKNYGKAFFVGGNTYGKGVAQSLFQLSDGSILKTTIFKFFTPSDKPIDNVGVSPNLASSSIDSAIIAELLLGDPLNVKSKSRYIDVKVSGKDFWIDLNKITGAYYWEIYRYILGKATSYTMLDYQSTLSRYVTPKTTVPKVTFSAMPKTEYKVGDRITFKLSTPNYSGKVQYRVRLWDSNTNTYKDLWSGDRYYTNWEPFGKETFNLGWKALKPGDYRIQVYVKRAGVPNSKTALAGWNCDSYLGEIPFVVTG